MVDCCCATYTPIPKMSYFTQNAIEAGNLQFFQNIKDDKSIKEIVSRRTELSSLTFFELALKHGKWQLCDFFVTNKQWFPYTAQQFFKGMKLDKNLFRDFFKLALEHKHNSLNLEGFVYAPNATTKNRKKFLCELAKLANEKNNDAYQKQIEILMKRYNVAREKKVHSEISRLNLFDEKELNTIIIDYLDPTEKPRYQPGKFNIF